jgi:dTDP-4-amino-4,6-dideoxygalactose transaminase
MGVLSFHETKNIMCGEGGALIIKNQGEYELAEMIREKGTNRGQFLRGEVEKYTWQTVGSSYLSSDLLAALLYAQLEEVEYIHKKRQYLYEKYIEGLTPLANKGLIELPIIPDYATSNYHIFHFWLRDHDTRSHLIQFLKEAGIQATFHYVPLHLSPMGRTFGYTEGMLPVTESSAARLLRLPLYPDLTDESLAYIIGKIEAFLLRRAGDPLWRET